MEGSTFKKLEKLNNYAVITAVVTNTLTAMGRFKSIPRSTIISDVYSKLKERASK